MKKILLLAVLIGATKGYGQSKDKEYIQLPGGVAYKMLHDAPGTDYPKTGDYVGTNIYLEVEGKEVYNSYTANKGQPISFFLTQNDFKTDVQEVIRLMTAGDSVAIRMSVDSMMKTPAPKEAWMKPGTGQQITYTIKLLSFKNLSEKK